MTTWKTVSKISFEALRSQHPGVDAKRWHTKRKLP
jgi:hypothetical protein